jgi:hypothetical protein
MPHVRSGPLAAWTTAWLGGLVSADDVLDATRADDGPHQVTGAATSLLDLLAQWRRSGEPVRLVLPVAGDVRGVPGPDRFRAAALDAGEAVVGAGLAATPLVHHSELSSAPPTVLWEAFEVEPARADFVQLGEAAHELAEAVRACATALAAADVAGSAGDIAAQLRNARRAGERLNLPPNWPPRAINLLAQAERLQAVLDLAELDPVGGAVDRFGIAARDSALRPLATAVRRARLAAYNAGVYE